ncbi:unnamed protein product, partial [Phaeothamnion confervicola]
PRRRRHRVVTHLARSLAGRCPGSVPRSGTPGRLRALLHPRREWLSLLPGLLRGPGARRRRPRDSVFEQPPSDGGGRRAYRNRGPKKGAQAALRSSERAGSRHPSLDPERKAQPGPG